MRPHLPTPYQPMSWFARDVTRAGRRASLEELTLSCFTGSHHEAADELIRQAAAGQGGYACFCNVHLAMTALGQPDVLAALQGASVRFPDGAPIAWLQRRLGSFKARRIAGPDLMPLVMDRGRGVDLAHFLLGSTPDVLRLLEQLLRVRYPEARLVGSYAPPLDEGLADATKALQRVREARPQIVWCAFGAPKQELWMHRHAESIPGVVFVGVGAAFDFIAGTKRRAPRWMRKSGLEWMHRLITEPRRLGRRYVTTNTAFLVGACAIALTRLLGRSGARARELRGGCP
jgi:N-acetylglucosaminyldiphosphoundecaprenol N-acetyl-beta-D-mannosaminyltransferase